jgi:hypothetical protein
MYAGRQCRAEIKMLYGNMVKNFIRAGDASVVLRRKEAVVRRWYIADMYHQMFGSTYSVTWTGLRMQVMLELERGC